MATCLRFLKKKSTLKIDNDDSLAVIFTHFAQTQTSKKKTLVKDKRVN